MEFTDQDLMDAFGLTEEDMTEEPDAEEDLQELEETDDAEDGEQQEEDGGDAGQEDPFREERERIEAQNQKDRQAALDAQVASMGLKDPYRNNAPIKTNAELLAYQQSARQDKLARMAKAGGLTEEELQELIDQHPDVVAGKQLKQQMEQQNADNARKQAERALAADIAEIGKLMPGIDSEEKIVTHESWPKVKKLMEDDDKLGLKKAFILANIDAIQANTGKMARDAARRNAAGKSHLKPSGGRGSGLPEVPADVRAIYKAFDPGMSDAEIRKSYAESLKNN